MATDTQQSHVPKNRIRALLLRREPSGKVRVGPEDLDRFAIQREKAARILRLVDRTEQFEKQFSLLLDTLGNWVSQNRGKVSDSYVTLQEGVLSLVVIRKQPEYDADFEDVLSELEVDIANDPDLNLIEFTTMPLPPVSEAALRSFINESVCLKYVG